MGQSIERFGSAVGCLRAAGLVPTFSRLAAAHVLGRAGRRLDIDDLVAQAHEEGLPLSAAGAREALDSLERSGMFAAASRSVPCERDGLAMARPTAPTAVERQAVVRSLLRLIGNPRRLAIIYLLAHGERTVGTVARHIGLGQSATSQHLARLRAAGVVATRRDNQRIHYRIEPAVAEVLRHPLSTLARLLTNVKESALAIDENANALRLHDGSED